jgi:hypothetical protein
MTLSVMTLNLMILSITIKNVTLGINDNIKVASVTQRSS